MSGNNFDDFRPEAQPYKYSDLNRSQQNSINQLVKMLDKAVKELDDSDKKPQKSNDNEEESHFFPIMDNNLNRTAFLSGGRGSGKTSVLYSLVNFLNGVGSVKEEPINAPKLIERITSLKGRVVWLRPLQMETLPNMTNLWVAILARIGEEVERSIGYTRHNRGRNDSCFDLNKDQQDALTDFDYLKKEVAMAWDGNLEAHAAIMDPDVYAVEVLRTEQTRFKLNDNIGKTLAKLSKNLIRGNPLFVLPVEDFDLNPLSSIHLARLIKLSSIPCLFTIILGDVDITRKIFNLNLKGGFSSAANETISPHLPLYNRIAHENSANLVRKVFPRSHIIELNPMKHDEVLEFPLKNKDKGDCIENIFKILPVYINTRDDIEEQFVAGNKIQCLHDFLNVKVGDLVVWTGDDKKSDKLVYITEKLLKMNPRHVQDLWRYLKDLVKNELEKNGGKRRCSSLLKDLAEENDEVKRSDFLGNLAEENKKEGSGDPNEKEICSNPSEIFAYDFFKETAREGKDLSLEMSEGLLKSVRLDFEGYVQLKTEHMKIESEAGPGLKVNAEDESRITVRLPKDWICKILVSTVNGKDSNQWTELSEATSVAMMLLHDLMVLSKPNGTIGPSLMKKLYGPCWAYTLWPASNTGGVAVRWHAPPWRSLWAHDFMRHCWAKVWYWLDNLKDFDKNPDALGEFLAYCWIKIGTGVFEDSLDRNDLTKSKTAIEEKRAYVTKIYNSEKNDYFDDSGNLKELEKLIKHISYVQEDEKIYSKILPYLSLLYLPSQDDEYYEHNKDHSLLPSINEGAIKMNCAWEWLILCIVDRIDKDKKIMKHKENLLRGWMARIASLLAPESGVNQKIFERFYNVEPIRSFWEKPEVAHEIRRVRALSAVKFFDSGVINKLYELYRPILREAYRKAPCEAFDNPTVCDTDKYKFNTEGKLFRPYIEDIVALSTLTKTRREYFENKLMSLCIFENQQGR